jgi:hypothetical protein
LAQSWLADDPPGARQPIRPEDTTMMKSLRAAVIAISLIAGPALAQGTMTASATAADDAGANVLVPTLPAKVHAKVHPKARTGMHKSSLHELHMHMTSVKHVKEISKHVKHAKHFTTVKRIKHQAGIRSPAKCFDKSVAAIQWAGAASGKHGGA